MTEQQIREQFAIDLKERFKANLLFNAVFGQPIHFRIKEIEQIIDETLKQVIPTEEEIKKMEE